MERITKEALEYSTLPAIGKQTASIWCCSRPTSTGSTDHPDAEPKILDVQRAADNTEPLLKAVGADDLSRMVRNAEQRAQAKGKEEDGYDL